MKIGWRWWGGGKGGWEGMEGGRVMDDLDFSFLCVETLAITGWVIFLFRRQRYVRVKRDLR